MLPIELEGNVYVTVHLPLVAMQLLGLKMPPAPPSLHDIMPIIEDEGLEMSVTDAVTSNAFPEVDVSGFDVTLVAVESGVLYADVLLLLVNARLLSASAGVIIKLPKSNVQNRAPCRIHVVFLLSKCLLKSNMLLILDTLISNFDTVDLSHDTSESAHI